MCVLSSEDHELFRRPNLANKNVRIVNHSAIMIIILLLTIMHAHVVEMDQQIFTALQSWSLAQSDLPKTLITFNRLTPGTYLWYQLHVLVQDTVVIVLRYTKKRSTTPVVHTISLGILTDEYSYSSPDINEFPSSALLVLHKRVLRTFLYSISY